MAATAVISVLAVTAKPGGRRDHAVAVAHPGGLRRKQLAEQHAAFGQLDRGLAELSHAGVRDLASERVGHRLHAVADAQHRYPEMEQAGIDHRRTRLVDGRRATREDYADGVAGSHLGRGQLVRDDLRVHPALPHPTRDQLRVLGPEVDHQHRTMRSCRRPPLRC